MSDKKTWYLFQWRQKDGPVEGVRGEPKEDNFDWRAMPWEEIAFLTIDPKHWKLDRMRMSVPEHAEPRGSKGYHNEWTEDLVEILNGREVDWRAKNDPFNPPKQDYWAEFMMTYKVGSNGEGYFKDRSIEKTKCKGIRHHIDNGHYGRRQNRLMAEIWESLSKDLVPAERHKNGNIKTAKHILGWQGVWISKDDLWTRMQELLAREKVVESPWGARKPRETVHGHSVNVEGVFAAGHGVTWDQFRPVELHGEGSRERQTLKWCYNATLNPWKYEYLRPPDGWLRLDYHPSADTDNRHLLKNEMIKSFLEVFSDERRGGVFVRESELPAEADLSGKTPKWSDKYLIEDSESPTISPAKEEKENKKSKKIAAVIEVLDKAFEEEEIDWGEGWVPENLADKLISLIVCEPPAKSTKGRISKAIEKHEIKSETILKLQYSDGCDVFIHNSEDAFQHTDTAEKVARFMSGPYLNEIVSPYGSSSEKSYLHWYFANFLENYDGDLPEHESLIPEFLKKVPTNCEELLERETEAYDHKRGWCDVSVELGIKAGDALKWGKILDANLSGWEVSFEDADENEIKVKIK